MGSWEVKHRLTGAKLLRLAQGANVFTNEHAHSNGMESFWAYAKWRLSKVKGIQKHKFYYHLKETEFRFHHRCDNLYLVLLKWLHEKPI